MNIYSNIPRAKYKSNRIEWPLGITKLVVFPEFTKYPIKVPTNYLNDPVLVAWEAGQALEFWQTQVNFATHSATTALGISAKHITGSLSLINSIF